MAADSCAVITAAVEGVVDEAVARALVGRAHGTIGAVYGGQGKAQLLRQLRRYNEAARHASWLVLVDLDGDFDCAPSAIREWLPIPAAGMVCTIAVRAVEAWLLADAERIAAFLGVPRTRVARDPESLTDPKRALVDLARRSRSRSILADLVPREGSGRVVGAAYTARLVEFVSGRWRPDVAAERSPSLRRGLMAVQKLLGAG